METGEDKMEKLAVRPRYIPQSSPAQTQINSDRNNFLKQKNNKMLQNVNGDIFLVIKVKEKIN